MKYKGRTHNWGDVTYANKRHLLHKRRPEGRGYSLACNKWEVRYEYEVSKLNDHEVSSVDKVTTCKLCLRSKVWQAMKPTSTAPTVAKGKDMKTDKRKYTTALFVEVVGGSEMETKFRDLLSTLIKNQEIKSFRFRLKEADSPTSTDDTLKIEE